MGADVKMNCKDGGYEHMDWIHLDDNKDERWLLVNMVINFCVHKRLEFLD